MAAGECRAFRPSLGGHEGRYVLKYVLGHVQKLQLCRCRKSQLRATWCVFTAPTISVELYQVLTGATKLPTDLSLLVVVINEQAYIRTCSC